MIQHPRRNKPYVTAYAVCRILEIRLLTIDNY